MSAMDFIEDAAKMTMTVASVFTLLPVFGAVGTLTAAGGCVALFVGTTYSFADHWDDKPSPK
ncbi:hypothetical protein ACET85_02905 [Aeromonas veronii]|uniref:hypothetical protein n=1 Tax=Aeromonas dhakensis TaxID=196024 RepID=UPI00288DD903|nr:hypothetical protein [Aeromonas dhakensis]HDZ8854373.1 hypothetical protein [Aeromonas dhakensis]